MSFVEFVEEVLDIKLLKCQKIYLAGMEKLLQNKDLNKLTMCKVWSIHYSK
jgi:hypothetical protein